MVRGGLAPLRVEQKIDKDGAVHNGGLRGEGLQEHLQLDAAALKLRGRECKHVAAREPLGDKRVELVEELCARRGK